MTYVSLAKPDQNQCSAQIAHTHSCLLCCSSAYEPTTSLIMSAVSFLRQSDCLKRDVSCHTDSRRHQARELTKLSIMCEGTAYSVMYQRQSSIVKETAVALPSVLKQCTAVQSKQCSHLFKQSRHVADCCALHHSCSAAGSRHKAGGDSMMLQVTLSDSCMPNDALLQ